MIFYPRMVNYGIGTKETVKGTNLIENLKKILSTARASGIKVVYVPHRNYEKGDFADWKFSPTHEGCLKYSLFERGSWGGKFHPISCLKAEIISLKIIGPPVVLQIQISTFC